jgi:transcriptional regulator with XRE-family HTH domain
MGSNKIGLRVRTMRESKKISIEELAKRSGLDAGFLRQLESEDLYPSIGPLLKISRALGARLGTFIDDQVTADPHIVRVAERREELTMATGKDTPAALRFHSLGRGKADRHMEPFFIDILPESEKDKKLSTHEGEEFIVVTAGEVQVIYGEQTHRLRTGDSMYYNSVVPPTSRRWAAPQPSSPSSTSRREGVATCARTATCPMN